KFKWIRAIGISEDGVSARLSDAFRKLRAEKAARLDVFTVGNPFARQRAAARLVRTDIADTTDVPLMGGGRTIKVIAACLAIPRKMICAAESVAAVVAKCLHSLIRIERVVKNATGKFHVRTGERDGCGDGAFRKHRW